MEMAILGVGFVALLVYLYFHEKNQSDYIKQIQDNLTNLPIDLQKFYTELQQKNNERSQKIIGDSFKDFLKHIEKLEKMVLPKPVTTRDVQSVMSRMGTLADESLEIEHDLKNDIETAEKGVELPNDEWAGLINAQTKVAFEGAELPTIIEE